MQPHQVSASGLVKAPADRVYALIADYRNGHPHILPKQYFTQLTVEEGGIGAGTRIRFQMKLMGRTQNFHAAISEPEPGRLLAETDLDSGAVTTFTVQRVEGSNNSQVTITTEMQTRSGIAGRIQRFLMTRLLQPVYTAELAQLAIFAENQKAEPG